MKILVTGGAGFIGSHVCDALLERGDSVICVDNFNDYYSPEIKRGNIKHNLDNEEFKLFETDILDFEGMKKIFESEELDKVVHLAARAGVRPSIKNPFLYQEVNVKGTLNLLELAKDFNIKNFIFGSSSSVYGNNKKIPFSEEDNVDFPISPYAATKKEGELNCYTYHHLHGLNISCLRFFTVYGPRGRPDMAPYLFTKTIFEGGLITRYGDGSTSRDYTYVSDIVKGIMAALDKDLKFEIINLGNSSPVRLNELIAVVEKHVGKKVEIVSEEIPQGDVIITYADISKAQKLLGYVPQVSLDEGIGKLVKWYLGGRK
jgi:UDP-glucuronate 4-epimerase